MSTLQTLNNNESWLIARWKINDNFTALNTDKAEKSGGTFTGDISVPDEAYWAWWNGSLEVPTKNAVYDKIETMWGGGSTTLAWLTDVDIVTPANWEIISYNSTSTKWENVPLSGGGDMLASTYDPAGIAQQVAGLTATQTFSTGVKTFLAGMFWLRNVANTFTSFFTNTNTASRTYTLKDANGTLAFTTDITGTNSGTNTGDQTSIVGITGTKAQFDTAITDWNILYVGDIVSSSTTAQGIVELATTAEINTGTDSTRAMPIDQFVDSNRNVRYFDIYAIEKTTDNAVGTNIIGAIECPFTWTITEIGAYVETAWVTGASVWDVNKNGTTIMTTNKLSIDSAEVSTRTATTAPTLTTTAITAGDLITIDTDSLSTTKPKGLHVRIWIRQS